MQIYFHSRLCSYLPRVPILVEGTVYIYILFLSLYIGIYQSLFFSVVTNISVTFSTVAPETSSAGNVV